MRQHTADKPESQNLFEGARQAVDALENASDRPFGASKEVVGNADANFGDLVLVNPTGGALTVSLPLAAASDVDKAITIKNNSASTNNVTILCAGNDTLDGASTQVIGTARFGRIIKVAAAGIWVIIGGI